MDERPWQLFGFERRTEILDCKAKTLRFALFLRQKCLIF